MEWSNNHKMNRGTIIDYKAVVNHKTIFLLGTFLFWSSLYTYTPILTPYVETLGASHKMAGIIVGSYGFTQMLLRIPVGIASDRLRKRKIFISLGLLSSILSALGFLLTDNLTLILISRSLAGVAAATWVDFTILYSSYHKPEESTKAMGTLSFMSTLGQVAAMYSGGILSDSYGWTSPFLLSCIIGAIGLGFSVFIKDVYEDKPNKITISGVASVVSDRMLITVSVIAILSQVMTFSTVYGFTPLYVSTQLGVSKYQMGLLTVFSTLPTALASLASGNYLVKKYGERAIIAVGFVISGLFTIIIPFIDNFNLLLATQVFAGIGRGMSFPMLMGLSIKYISTDKRATAMGFFQAIYGLGMFVGPVVMGTIGDLAGLNTGFIIIGISGLLTALGTMVVIAGTTTPKSSLST